MSNITDKSPKKRKSIVKAEATPKKQKIAAENTNSAKKPNKTPNKKTTPNKKPGNLLGKVVDMKKKKFAGTNKLNGKTFEKKTTPEGKKATLFYFLQQKLNSLSQEDALKDIDKRMEAIKARKSVSKTAKRKLKSLKRYKSIISQGLKISDKPLKKANANEEKAKLKIEKEESDSDEDGDSEDDEEGSSNESEPTPAQTPSKKANEAANNKQIKNEPKQTVIITNLGSDATRNDIVAHLKPCGKIGNINVIKDKKIEGKQIAFVTVQNEEVLQKILAHNQTSIKGENIEIKLKQATPMKPANKNLSLAGKKTPGSAKPNRKSIKSSKNLNTTS